MDKSERSKFGGTFLNNIADNSAQGGTLKVHLLMVAGGYLAIAVVELLAHWLLTWHLFAIPLWIYLLHTPSGGMAIFTDLLLPALLLGWWNAWVGRLSSPRRAAALVLPLAFGTIALLPLYAMLIGKQHTVWWWPRTTAEIVLFLAVQLFFAAIAVLLPIRAYHKGFPI